MYNFINFGNKNFTGVENVNNSFSVSAWVGRPCDTVIIGGKTKKSHQYSTMPLCYDIEILNYSYDVDNYTEKKKMLANIDKYFHQRTCGSFSFKFKTIPEEAIGFVNTDTVYTGEIYYDAEDIENNNFCSEYLRFEFVYKTTIVTNTETRHVKITVDFSREDF